MQQNIFSFKAKHTTGVLGEELAREFLLGKGYRIIGSGFRIPGGEIDLIAEFGNELCFIEVKTRRSYAFGPPEEALNRYKKHKLLRAVCTWLHKSGRRGGWRLDLITVVLPGRRQAFIKHYRDILAD